MEEYFTSEQIERAKQMDLLTYLMNYEPQELVRLTRNVYTTKTHDSLKISNGMWMWWSRGFGGKGAVDYLVRVRNIPFMKAVGMVLSREKSFKPMKVQAKNKSPPKQMILPSKAEDNDAVIDYLKSRGINEDVITYFIDKGYIYQSALYDNIIFVGYDNDNNPKYAGVRSIEKCGYKGDVYGSDKRFPFRLVNDNNINLHIFEGAIDLLSYATLLYEQGSDFTSQNLVSLSGVYKPKFETANAEIPLALRNLLQEKTNIKNIYLHLDNDTAGKTAAMVLTKILKDKYNVINHTVPKGKDVNDYLCYRKNIPFKTNKERMDAR